MNCFAKENNRRRVFWATNPNACGSFDACGNTCGLPGLSRIKTKSGTTIETQNYVAGLALNILLTEAKKEDSPCGYLAGRSGGHWSDSYTNEKTGSNLWRIPTNYNIRETVNLIKAHVQNDCQKLVRYGVAEKVETQVTYNGKNTIDILLNIFGRSGEITRVGLAGVRQKNNWLWNIGDQNYGEKVQ